MTVVACLLLGVLSIWDYPIRQPRHEALRRDFLEAMRTTDYGTMADVCRRGVELLPDDPTWRFNLACALAHGTDPKAAFATLEQAIDLGFRDDRALAEDEDLKCLADRKRLDELIAYARGQKDRPILSGPLAQLPVTGVFGSSLMLGEQNLGWNFDLGCFVANMCLSYASAGGNTGDLYMNRDNGHSAPRREVFPGLTEVKLDKAGRARKMDLDFPNIQFPYPVFGNASRAYVNGAYWRSLPRAMMTGGAGQMRRMEAFYLSNQVWVFPAHADFPPIGTNGDCFAAVTPYWLTSQGRSWSDQYYLRAALEVSRSLSLETKREIVRRGLLAPTVQALIRKSLKGVTNEVTYLSAKAHPTALPPNGLDLPRLARQAASMRTNAIPPVVTLSVKLRMTRGPDPIPECIFATRCAGAFVLRGLEGTRELFIKGNGAEAYAFRVVHGDAGLVKIENLRPDVVKVTVDRRQMTGRIDIAVFGRADRSGWGAPSFISLSVPPGETRTWRADGRTATIDYRRAPGVYADPILFPKRDWMETIEYDGNGNFVRAVRNREADKSK